MGKKNKHSKKVNKKESTVSIQKEKAVILDAKEISEIPKSQIIPQEILNTELANHINFNQKLLNNLNVCIEKQQKTIKEYNAKSSKVKSISLLKNIILKLRRLYEVKFNSRKEHKDELEILDKQVKSNLKEIDKAEHTRENIVKFLTIPYKTEYKSDEIDNIIKIIENSETSKKDAKEAVLKYSKLLSKKIRTNHEKIKEDDFNCRYIKIDEKYDPAKIFESSEISDIQKQNEEIVYSSFKLLKSNIEITLLIDELVTSKEHSKLFINFLKELKHKLDESYENIGQNELKKLLDEIKEDAKIEDTKEKIEESIESLEKTIEDDIQKGNEEIEKQLMDATPKNQKK